jgi:peroxiredoxin
MSSPKPNVGRPLGPMSFNHVDGGTRSIGEGGDRWSILFVYRGKHCPRCKRYLNKLEAALPAWQEHMNVLVVSADTQEKAAADKAEFGWSFDLCYGLSVNQMRALGVYVSEPLSEAETDAPFAEPGTFAMRPDGTLMLVDISNGPASRPDLEEFLDGMIFSITNDRPVRGLA